MSQVGMGSGYIVVVFKSNGMGDQEAVVLK